MSTTGAPTPEPSSAAAPTLGVPTPAATTQSPTVSPLAAQQITFALLVPPSVAAAMVAPNSSYVAQFVELTAVALGVDPRSIQDVTFVLSANASTAAVWHSQSASRRTLKALKASRPGLRAESTRARLEAQLPPSSRVSVSFTLVSVANASSVVSNATQTQTPLQLLQNFTAQLLTAGPLAQALTAVFAAVVDTTTQIVIAPLPPAPTEAPTSAAATATTALPASTTGSPGTSAAATTASASSTAPTTPSGPAVTTPGPTTQGAAAASPLATWAGSLTSSVTIESVIGVLLVAVVVGVLYMVLTGERNAKRAPKARPPAKVGGYAGARRRPARSDFGADAYSKLSF